MSGAELCLIVGVHATMEDSEESTVAAEEFLLNTTHEIVHGVSPIHSIYRINVFKEISHAPSSMAH